MKHSIMRLFVLLSSFHRSYSMHVFHFIQFAQPYSDYRTAIRSKKNIWSTEVYMLLQNQSVLEISSHEIAPFRSASHLSSMLRPIWRNREVVMIGRSSDIRFWWYFTRKQYSTGSIIPRDKLSYLRAIRSARFRPRRSPIWVDARGFMVHIYTAGYDAVSL